MDNLYLTLKLLVKTMYFQWKLKQGVPRSPCMIHYTCEEVVGVVEIGWYINIVYFNHNIWF